MSEVKEIQSTKLEAVVEFYLCEDHAEEYSPRIHRGLIWLDNSGVCGIGDCFKQSRYKVEIKGMLEI